MTGENDPPQFFDLHNEGKGEEGNEKKRIAEGDPSPLHFLTFCDDVAQQRTIINLVVISVLTFIFSFP